ncbi:MAG: hypothetical protein ABI142_03685, partial [Bryocella sp.]
MTPAPSDDQVPQGFSLGSHSAPKEEGALAPVVALAEDAIVPRSRLQRLIRRLSGPQFLRYLAVGIFNTVF